MTARPAPPQCRCSPACPAPGGHTGRVQRGCPPSGRLLAAAEELFAERSYRQATVAQICHRAGMATGSFYAHFGSKEEIFAAVVRRISADLISAVRAAAEQADGSRETECACFRSLLEMLIKQPRMDRIVRESEFVAPSLFHEHYERLARTCARSVRQAQSAGRVDARYDPEVVACIYAGISSFISMRWAAGEVPGDVLDDVLAVLACGLPPHGQPARLDRMQNKLRGTAG